MGLPRLSTGDIVRCIYDSARTLEEEHVRNIWPKAIGKKIEYLMRVV